MENDFEALARYPDIIVATPGTIFLPVLIHRSFDASSYGSAWFQLEICGIYIFMTIFYSFKTSCLYSCTLFMMKPISSLKWVLLPNWMRSAVNFQRIVSPSWFLLLSLESCLNSVVLAWKTLRWSVWMLRTSWAPIWVIPFCLFDRHVSSVCVYWIGREDCRFGVYASRDPLWLHGYYHFRCHTSPRRVPFYILFISVCSFIALSPSYLYEILKLNQISCTTIYGSMDISFMNDPFFH